MRVWPIGVVVSVWMAAAVSHVQCGDSDRDPARDPQTECKAAIAAFGANYHAFTFYRCRYRLTKAQAASFKDALDRKWISAESSEFLTVLDGQKEMTTCFAPPPVSVARPGRKSGTSISFEAAAFVGGGYISGGDKEMSYVKGLQSAGLFTSASPYGGKEYLSPLGMGCMGYHNQLGPDQLQEIGSEWGATYRGRQEIDSHPVHAIDFHDLRDNKVGTSFQFFLDPANGYLPARVNIDFASKPKVDGRPKTQVFLQQARECSRQRWFPEQTLVVDTPDKGGDAYDVTEIKVLELDTDKRPSDDDFALDLPAGTSVWDPNQPTKGKYRLKQDERVTLRDLPSMFEMLDKAKQNPLMDTAVPHRRSRVWLRWAGAGLGILLILAAVVIARRRRAAP